MKFQENIPLAKYTTFKVGGPAKLFYLSKNEKDLVEAIAKGKEEKLKIFVIGGGSNLLISDKGFDGLVIKIGDNQIEIKDTEVKVGAGAQLPDLVSRTADNALVGFEWAAGVPGTVGGAIYGNANAYGVAISDYLITVDCLNRKSFEIKTLDKKDCRFNEKTSIFKENKDLVILSAIFKLKTGDKKMIKKEISDRIVLRASKHPLEYGSAGSIFVNKPGQEKPSSYLIELAGLKGRKVGGAEVSTKHGGFIVNKNNATCQDILDLIEIVKREVKKKHGVDLETEVQIVG